MPITKRQIKEIDVEVDIERGRKRRKVNRPLCPYNAGTEHVALSPTRQTLLAPSAKRSPVGS